ncbi:MAG: hypothetical protein JO021_05555 [Alphaproteobacteria bacterium]|nr:hypothetical protein [Alphaproteobacteria bacterium]
MIRLALAAAALVVALAVLATMPRGGDGAADVIAACTACHDAAFILLPR